ncbi:protein YgfX [Pseudomonas sp. CAU 1711]|uniref:protein YgfX n=1 Tax=Pseudomonas sp. CAU 1711 TaxID=3140356 RepID=UPI0032609ED7
MSSPSERFECRWRASRLLLAAYLAALSLALLTLLLIDLPLWGALLGTLACLAHAAWALPRQILLSHPAAFTGLRRDERGWQLFSARGGWQAVQLRPDSLALPLAVVLSFRLAGERRVRGLCIPRDALPRDLHRRLRVRLKFSRRRWAAPE